MSKQTDLINVTDAITVSGSNVGIGTSSPSYGLHLASSTDAQAAGQFERTGGAVVRIQPEGFDAKFGTFSNTPLEFMTNSTERMRIDSSGNLLVGKTSGPNYNAVGVDLTALGEGQFTVSSNPVLQLNRQSTDGDIAMFRKDGTTVGSIGSRSSGQGIFINSQAGADLVVQLAGNDRFGFADNYFYARQDNLRDLGLAYLRWDDIYATNGSIQTSDRNEKQDIEVLSDAETRVAVACKGLLRKFRWQDAVAEKGDDARIHFGIIAQDLQDAFAAEGLDAGRYAMFISSTWWEATETYTDDDGVEQTRTDTYETQAEAPEGATERTRLGVRYPELLAFIIGAM